MRKPRNVEVQWSSTTRIWTRAVHLISACSPPSKAGAPLAPLSLQPELQLNLGNLILNIFYHLSGSLFITAPWPANKLYSHHQDTVSSNLRVLTLCFWMLQETRAVAEAEKRLLLKTDCFQSNKKQTSLAFHTRFTFLAPHSSFFVSCMKRPFSGETSQLLFTGLHGLIWKNSRVHTAIAVFVSPLPLGWLGQPGDAWRGHCGGRGGETSSKCRGRGMEGPGNAIASSVAVS